MTLKNMQSPFFMKLYFYQPSEENTSKNISHLSYIALRPGVDVGVEMSNMLEEEKETAAAHVRYAHERPRSHGLFSSEEIGGVKEIQSELKDHKGIVWRTILSLNEVDAIRLGYDRREAWENLLKTNVPLMAHQMGIPESNLKWVAAFHEEKGHPHVHLVLWEKTPMRRRGVIGEWDRKQIEKLFVKEIYENERIRLAQEKTAERDLIMQVAKDDLIKTVEILRDLDKGQAEIELEMKAAGAMKSVGIAPKMFREDHHKLAKEIQLLSAMMPQRGRIAYQYMTEKVKEKVRDIATLILNHPAQKKALNQYLKAAEDMARPYSHQEEHLKAARENAYKDIQKRVSQLILKAASESNKKQFVNIDIEKSQVVVQKFSQAMGAPEDIEHSVLKEITKQLRNIGFSKENQIQFFKDWANQSDIKIPSDRINQWIDQAYKQLAIDGTKVNYIAIGTALKIGGRTDEEVIHQLSQLSISRDKAAGYVQEANRLLATDEQLFLTRGEWDRFVKNTDLRQESVYPWQVEEIAEIDENRRKSITEAFRHSQLSDRVPDYDGNWTGFCMAVALKQMNVPFRERSEVLREWAARNPISDMNAVIEKVESAKTNFLRESTWKTVMANLNLNIPYPWNFKEEVRLDRDELKRAIDSAVRAVPEDRKLSIKEAQWTAQTYVRMMKELNYQPEQIQSHLKLWNKANQLNEKELQAALNIVQKRNDIELLHKQFGLKDIQRETVTNFAKVLFAAGMSSEQVTQQIQNWNQRSRAHIPDQKIEIAIIAAEKYCRDLTEWGRDPFLSRKQFDKLCKTLKVEAPWMWKGNREFRRFQKESSLNSAQSLWKAVWRNIEREREQTLAKGELQRKQEIRRQVIYQMQSEEQER